MSKTSGPFDARLSADALAAYGPTAIATRIWEAQEEGRAALVPASLQAGATGGVHGEHDVVLHRPLVAGEALSTWVSWWGARPAGRNSLVTLHYRTVDASSAVVAEQWWTTVFLGVRCETSGEPPPDHSFPADAPLAGTWSTSIDVDLARRYAEASGDWSAHHFTGDRPFLHGLCTMSLCARGVASVAGCDDVRRVAVRFASPTYLGESLQVHVHDAGPLGFAFTAESDGVAVITNGRLEPR